MIRYLCFALALLGALLANGNDFRMYYIDQYKEIAIQEMDRTGVPASIKLAQGILESNYGRSDLATQANNHFGIKCGGSWDGRQYYKEDDDFDKNGQLIKSCFRVFQSAEASYIAHSDFLRDPGKSKRYGFLFSLDPLDYQSWARGLKQAGYATSPTYHDKLIAIIEKFELHQYDRIAGSGLPFVYAPQTPFSNDVRYTLTDNNESLSTIARKSAISLSQLIRYNEQLNDAEQRLASGTLVYLQSKRNHYRGKSNKHTVKHGESMFDISQQYGLKLSKLLSRNLLSPGMEPAPGEQLVLRGAKLKKRPMLKSELRQPPLVYQPTERVSSPSVPAAMVNQMPAFTPSDSVGVFHTVVVGDTLWNIAQRHQTTVAELRTINNLPGDQIQIGQQLRIK
jgi:LysM repeat protein